jgi:hypothetical protein
MKAILYTTLAAMALVSSTSFASFGRTKRFSAKTAAQPSYNTAVTAGRQLAAEIDAGQNRKANSSMRFQKCNVRRGGKYIVITSMTIQEVFQGDLNQPSYVAKVSYKNTRCERDDD